MKKIILSGYMASGKTTIASLLSKATGLSFIDLDNLIEKKTGKPITQIFEEDGEIRFRKIEHESLKQLLDKEQGFVLALGGGTPCYAGNHEFLKREDVVSIYLKTSIGELAKRLAHQPGERPLLTNLKPEEMEEYIAKHLFDRSYYYLQSKHTVSTDGKTPKAVVNEIVSLF